MLFIYQVYHVSYHVFLYLGLLGNLIGKRHEYRTVSPINDNMYAKSKEYLLKEN